MTLADADNIASRIIALPRLYESPRHTPYYDLKWSGVNSTNGMANYPWARSLLHKENFYDASFFSPKAYSGVIENWESTPRDAANPAHRYVTIDDLRMMAYVGIEYARAKISYGWRYKTLIEGWWLGFSYEDRIWDAVPRAGCIVRSENGQRYICRQQPKEPSLADITAGYKMYLGEWDYRFWTPMHMMPGYGEPTIGYIVLEGDRIPKSRGIDSGINSELTIDTIEGNDDILQIAPVGSSLDIGEPEENVMVRSGGFSITISLNARSAFSETEKIVCYQQRVYPFYKVYSSKADYAADNGNFTYWKNLDEDSKKTGWYRVVYEIDYVAGQIPLKKGIKYDVSINFDNASVFKIDSNRLCSYIRTPTRKTAPYMWKSKHSKSPN